jgi:hypothetical protein
VATSPVLGLPLPNSTSTDQVPADLLTYSSAAELYFVGRFANSSTRDTKITSPTGGMVAWLVSPGKFVYYDATLGAWADLMNPTAWDTWTPTLQNGSASPVVLGTGGSQIGRYRVAGKTCTFQTTWNFGSGVNSSVNSLFFVLPPSLPAANVTGLRQTGICTLYVPSSDESYLGFWSVAPAGTVAQPSFPKDRVTAAMGVFRDTDGTGLSGLGVPNIPSAYPMQANGTMTAFGSYQLA